MTITKTLRSIASEKEQTTLLGEGLIEQRHLDAKIDAQQDRDGETYLRVDDLMIVLRDATEPTAYLLPDDELAIVLDCGGGITLQCKNYSAYHDQATFAAAYVHAYLDEQSTDGWDGDDLAACCAVSVDDLRNGAYRVLKMDDIRNALAAKEMPASSWGNANDLMRALGVRVF